MAYRRKQGGARDSTFKEEFGRPRRPIATPDASSSASAASSLAAKAIRASSAYRDSSLSSAYGQSAISPREPSDPGTHSPSVTKDSTTYEYTSLSSSSESKPRFWRVLARKAKAVLDDDDAAKRFETPGSTRLQMFDAASKGQSNNPYLPENQRKKDSPALQKGLGSIASSLNYIGSSIGNALEEGLAIMENRTADIIQETRKLQVRKKDSQVQSQASNFSGGRQPPAMQPQMETDLEIQLKASRDVAMAMAAKAKLLLRELKTVKADLAFAKERCAQLEEENRVLRESHEKGDSPEDDDLIRLQLETLLAEKARLAQENSVFARENRFLREIVEYHQLTMQDVVYLDENSEEVSEVYPIRVSSATNPHSMGTKSSPPPEETCTRSPLAT